MECEYRNCSNNIGLDCREDRLYCSQKCRRNEKKYRQRERKRDYVKILNE